VSDGETSTRTTPKHAGASADRKQVERPSIVHTKLVAEWLPIA
jgi:hypothetical protein